MNEVATKKKQEVGAVSALEEFAGQGSEYVTAKDTKLPILKLINANSPFTNQNDAKFNKDAKVGDIFNEITGSLYNGNQGILVVPCLFINTLNEWADRGISPGRPSAMYKTLAEQVEAVGKTTRGDDNKDRLQNGNYIEDTGNHFVYILNDKYEPVEQALVTMKSTQKKISRLWVSMIQSRRLEGKKGFFTPPSWGTVYRLKSVQESNNKGSWIGWNITFDSYLNKPGQDKTLGLTKAFYKSAMESDIFGKVDFDEKPQATVEQTKDDVPF